MARYEIWYLDPLGNRVANINNVSGFSYVLVAGDVGFVQISVPAVGNVYEAVQPDYRIAIWRQPYGGKTRLETIAFVDFVSWATSQDGLDNFQMGASDLNDLLKRRIIAYNSGSNNSDFTGNFTSNQMTVVPKQNLGPSATDTTREIDAFGFSVAGDISAGAAISKQAAYKNALSVLQDMQAFSKQGGEEVFFGIVPTTETSMQFQTWANQPGADRTSSIVFSLERGNLLNPSLSYDYTQESNFIYAGGKGSEDERNIQTAEDSNATGRSPFARKERFVSAISGVKDNDDDQVQAKANDALEKHRAKINLSATIVSTPSAEYGLDWFFGDRVTIDYQGIQFNTVIRALQVSVDGNGRETVQARVESV